MKNHQKISPGLFALFSLLGGVLLLLLAYFLSKILSPDDLSASILSDLFSGIGSDSAEIDDAFGEIESETPLPNGSISDLIMMIIRIILGLFSVLLTGVALWSGTLFVVHLGEEQQVTNARKLLIWSLLGVVVTASSYALISGVLGLHFGA